MTAIPFDTHRFVENLRAAGVPNEQAVAHKDALANAAFATGGDIGELRGEIEKLEIKMKAENDRLNTKIDIILIGLALVIGLLAIPQVGGLFQ
uniref:DUF1640 domain-containing protein n=1 Tax=Candidatus Kentrum sp. DK TaxID=2126562 RepID=A0A450SCT2_9GAMM|nr:MAG: hypothetical protein BECKDK2373C_GA0170839_102813 [Candidatus Kentron sp. DK]